MKLTPELLLQVKAIIDKHHAVFVLESFGPEYVDPAIVAKLKASGIVPTSEDAFELAYTYGALVAKLEEAKIADWSLEKVQAELTKNPIPLSAAEKHAVQTAKMSAAMYCVGLGNTINKETGALIIDGDKKLQAAMQKVVQNKTSANIAARDGVKALKSKLGNATGDWSRNFDRIAITETHNVMQEGVTAGYRKDYGPDVRVFIRAMPDACAHCKRLHNGPDGAPRIFKLRQLAPAGANVGQKAANWVAVQGSVHPHCQCQISRVPVGWGFDENGTLIPGGEYGVEVEDVEKSLAAEDVHMDCLEKAYRLDGELNFQGLDIAIETGSGGLRFWKDRNGESGINPMLWPYGYIRNTMGVDGDAVDCYVGPNPDAEYAFIVHQRIKKQGGGFHGYDEDKVMLGFSSLSEARAAYLAHYDDEGFLGNVSIMRMEEFKAALPTAKEKPRKLTKSLESYLLGPAPVVQTPTPPRSVSNERFHVVPDVLGKSTTHLYIDKKKVGDHWVYTYADEHGGKVRPHATDDTKLTLKLPLAQAATLEALRLKHNISAPVVHGGKYVMLFVDKPPKPKKTPVVFKPPAASTNTDLKALAAQVAQASGLSMDEVRDAVSGSASVKDPKARNLNREKIERAIHAQGLARPDAVKEVLAHNGHNGTMVKKALEGITKGDLARATSEFARTPVYDLQVLSEVKLTPKSIPGRAVCYVQTRAISMGHDEVKKDFVTGDFRHELGHAVHFAWIESAQGTEDILRGEFKSVQERRKQNPSPKSSKMDSNWYEEKWGVTGARGADNHKENTAEHYRCYHRTLHQEQNGGSKGSTSLAQYRSRHPAMADLFDARYTAALLGLGATHGEW